MPWGALTNHAWTSDPARHADVESTKEVFISEAMASGLLLVEVAPPRSSLRGRLAALLEGAIERALEARGAPPPGRAAAASHDRGTALDDLLRRAEVSGTAGIAVWLSSLAEIALGGALDSEDSGTLRWWLSAAGEKPVRFGFAPENHSLGVYLAPVTLESILAEAVSVHDAQDDEPAALATAYQADRDTDDSRSSDEADEADEATSDTNSPAFEDDTGPDSSSPVSSAPQSTFADSARAMAEALSDGGETGWLRDALMDLSTPAPRPVLAESPEVRREPPRKSALPALKDDSDDVSLPPPPVVPRLDLRFADVEPPAAALQAEPVRFEVDAETRRHLEGCARELRALSGPKPLAVVERLFANAYVPLRTALDRGANLPALQETADEWARSFAKSYEDAFDALRVRTKRPTMVVDVPDITLRVARLHGARATQLLLVDGMRYDLGDRVNDRLRAIVGQRAACAERFLLWAALPTTTAAQLELIGRGAAGLREFTGEINEDLVVARGRKASMIRRLKTGHREVLKLDIVEARLAEPGGAAPEGFDGMADEVAERIAAHFEGLQPRTLVMVFGDHGFALSPESEGPRVARSGGASPEEVLVPAFAWLVGAVH